MKEVSLMQQNLKLERDLQVSLNQHLEGELSNAHHQHQKASDLERQMNELKLKMLIKFDKIKLLEDFYNVSSLFSLSRNTTQRDRSIWR
jgi:hypothetical protein